VKLTYCIWDKCLFCCFLPTSWISFLEWASSIRILSCNSAAISSTFAQRLLSFAVMWVWGYTGPHPVLCPPLSTSLLSFVFFFYHLWRLQSFSRSARHSRRLRCQHGLLMTPSVCSQEARGYVEVVQTLFSDGCKLLAYFQMASPFIWRWNIGVSSSTKGKTMWISNGGPGFRRALKRAPDHWRFPCFPRSLRDVNAVRINRMVHCHRFFYTRVVFLNAYWSLANHCYSLLDMNNGLLTHEAPISNATPASSFLTQNNSGYSS